MKIILLILALSIASSCEKTVFTFEQDPDLVYGPIYVGNNQIIIAYIISFPPSGRNETILTLFQLIDITSGEIKQNFTTYGLDFDQVLWMNGTETFMTIEGEEFRNFSQIEKLKLYNFGQSNPIKEYIILKTNTSEQLQVFLSQVEDSTDYVVIAGGWSNDLEIKTLNLLTGEYVYVEPLSSEINGFALNLNRYSYLESNKNLAQCSNNLIITNPKTKKMEYNFSIIQDQPSCSLQFNGISPFHSKKFGNLLSLQILLSQFILRGTFSNGSFFIRNTLTGGSITNQYLNFPQNNTILCTPINDEEQILFYCYSSDNLKTVAIYQGSKPTLIDSIVLSNAQGLVNIPESQQMLYVTGNTIQSWTYKTSAEQVIS